MAWDFETEPEFASSLAWMRDFVKTEIFPLEAIEVDYDTVLRIVAPLQAEVKARGLWAAHLTPDLGGQGFGQVKLALMHEILGQCAYAPLVFGNNAPDSGNAELLAIGSTSEEQKQRFLYPLLEGRLRSGFSMTEPENAGSDPTTLNTRAQLDGDEWVINGHKWFTTNGSIADFLIVMTVTDPEASRYERASMIIVPADTPGLEVVRDIPTMDHLDPQPGEFSNHAEIYYRDVRVPASNLIGKRGEGFLLAQKRLGPGRIHHAMRWLGQCQRALDMMCERAVSRMVRDEPLANRQAIQTFVADSVAEITQVRLLTLYAAWKMDKVGASGARTEIAMIKYAGAKVLHDVIDRAIQVHGTLGFSTDMPLEAMYRKARMARIVDGPDEVHRVTVARQTLRNYTPVTVPSEHVPTRRAEAIKRFASYLDEQAVSR